MMAVLTTTPLQYKLNIKILSMQDCFFSLAQYNTNSTYSVINDTRNLSIFIEFNMCVCVCLSVCLPACLPACLPVCPSVCLSVCMYVPVPVPVSVSVCFCETHIVTVKITFFCFIVRLYYTEKIIIIALARVPGIAQVNKKIMIRWSIPFSPIPFPFAIPGLHLPSPYSSFPIKVLVEHPIQVPIKLPIKVPV